MKAFFASRRHTKRNRIVLALLFPILVVLWLLGWVLFWMGVDATKNERRKVTFK